MPGDQLKQAMAATMNRRQFIVGAGIAVAGGVLIGVIEACGGGDSPGLITAPPVTGTLRGTVVDMSGRARAVGRIYLLKKNGLNTGAFVNVDAMGNYDFGAVATGEYLLRFWGANQAEVPEPLHNPVHITVAANAATVVNFQIEVSVNPIVEREIYAGDFFFQEQPIGPPNGTVVVKVGTLVCWYNVGEVAHTVTGGPWGDSGPIGRDGNFMWTADRVGIFPYRCSYHGTQMIATLQVVA